MRAALYPLLFCAAAGCQTYDFSPVEPLALAQTTDQREIAARATPPEVILLIDRSGSMLEPAEPTQAACVREGVTCGFGSWACAADCPTRWSELRLALATALPELTKSARVGALLYPHPDATTCEAPALEGSAAFIAPPSSDDPAELSAATARLLAVIDSAPPLGGTPTGAALRTIAAWFADPLRASQKRQAYVALLTDGLPNCNDENPADADVPGSGCECTVAVCQSSGSSLNPLHRAGCLDAATTVQTISSLESEGITTLVVGFGAELTGSRAQEVLNQMALAGGRPRSCQLDADCGAGDFCDVTGLCGRRFVPATQAQELVAAISTVCSSCEPCTFRLATSPEDPGWMTVQLDGALLQQGADTWHYEADPPRVIFEGGACARLEGSTEAAPVVVEVRVIEPL